LESSIALPEQGGDPQPGVGACGAREVGVSIPVEIALRGCQKERKAAAIPKCPVAFREGDSRSGLFDVPEVGVSVAVEIRETARPLLPDGNDRRRREPAVCRMRARA